LVLALILGLVISGVYFGWRVTNANEKIRTMLLARIRPFISQDSDIEKLEMDLNSIQLKGVSLIPKDGSFTLEIDNVKLGFRFWNLVFYGLALHKMTHQVLLEHPVLTLRKTPVEEGVPLSEEDFIDFRDWVERIRSMRRATVAGAEIVFEDTTGQKVQLAHSLNGWLEVDSPDSAFIRLSGKMFDAKSNNLDLEGKLNLLLGRPVWVNINMQTFEPVSTLPFLLPGYIHVSSGQIRGQIHYDRMEKMSGVLEIKNGSFHIKNTNIFFEDVNINGQFEKQDLVVTGQVGRFNGSTLDIQGRIKNITNHNLEVKVVSEELNLHRFFKEATPNAVLPINGNVQVDVNLTGTVYNPRVFGSFITHDLEIFGITFTRFQADLNVKEKLLRMQGKAVQNGGVGMQLSGSLDFSVPRTQASLSMSINGNVMNTFPDLMQKKLTSCPLDIQINLDGPLQDLQGNAAGSLTAFFLGDDPLRIQSTFWFEDSVLGVEMLSNKTLAVTGQAKYPFQKDVQWEVETRGLENIAVPFLGDKIRRWMSDWRFKGNIFGTLNSIEMTASAVNEEWENQVLNIQYNEEKKNRKKLFSVKASYFGKEGGEIPFFAQGKIEKEKVVIEQGTIGDFGILNVDYPFRSDDFLEAQFKLEDFFLEKLHTVFPEVVDFSGEIRGGIRVSGSRRQPAIKADFALREGIFHSEKNLEGDLQIHWKGRNLLSTSISLRKNGVAFLQGEAQQTEGDSVKGEFWGEGIVLENLAKAYYGESPIQGDGQVRFQMNGKSENPYLQGTVGIKNGRLGSFGFKELKFDFNDTLWTRAGWKRGLLLIQKGQLIRDDGLKVLVWGRIPHHPDEEADVSMHCEGNLLGVLPDIAPFFKSAKSNGELSLRWAGHLGDWVIGSGRLRLFDGEVELANVVKKINRIQGEFELDQNDRFVKIRDLSLETNNGTLFISNQRIDSENNMVPFTINPLRLNFGALHLKTSPKGIRLHIPGLMEKGEEGRLEFEGLIPENEFTVAGSPDRLLVRGTVGLTDSRITYPLLKVKDGNLDEVIRYLENIYWDLDVIPRHDVHYIRNIQMALGNVFVDLRLQDEYGHFRMKGIIEDGSLQTWGDLVSTEGTVDVLDLYFRPERIEFDLPQGASPIISGRAYTTVTDSLGMHSTVWLNLTAIDQETGMERQIGPWKNVQFRFSTDNPNLGRTEADLLAALGYSTENLADRAYDALGMQLENLVFRPIFRPLERSIRRHLGLDVVRLSSMFSRNIFRMQNVEEPTFDPRILLRSTKLTLGKYLAPGLFLTYSGEVQSDWAFQYPTQGIGFRHALSLEYVIRSDLMLQMEYTYDSQLLSDRREDKRIWLRHVFPF
jgi:hypothetical protein